MGTTNVLLVTESIFLVCYRLHCYGRSCTVQCLRLMSSLVEQKVWWTSFFNRACQFIATYVSTCMWKWRLWADFNPRPPGGRGLNLLTHVPLRHCHHHLFEFENPYRGEARSTHEINCPEKVWRMWARQFWIWKNLKSFEFSRRRRRRMLHQN